MVSFEKKGFLIYKYLYNLFFNKVAQNFVFLNYFVVITKFGVMFLVLFWFMQLCFGCLYIKNMVFLYLLQVLCLLAAIIFVNILPFFLVKRFYYKYALQIYYVFLSANTVANFHQILVLIYFQIIMLFYLLSCQKINFFLRAILLVMVYVGSVFNWTPQDYVIEERILNLSLEYDLYRLFLNFGKEILLSLYFLSLKELVCVFLPFSAIFFNFTEQVSVGCSMMSNKKILGEVLKYHKQYQIPDINELSKFSPLLGNLKNLASLDLMPIIADQRAFPHFKAHQDLQAKINAFRLSNTSTFEFQFASRKLFLEKLQNKFSSSRGLVQNLDVTHFELGDEIFPRECASYFLLEGTKIESNIYDPFHYQIVKNYDASRWKNNFLKGYVAISQVTGAATQLAINQGENMESIVFLPEFVIGKERNPGDFAMKLLLKNKVCVGEVKTILTIDYQNLFLKFYNVHNQWINRVPASELLGLINNLDAYISVDEFEKHKKLYKGSFPIINVKKPL